MKSLADALPPEIAQQIHPDWRKNEADYWSVRDELLSQYDGQWIGFADGAIIAAAAAPLEVFLSVQDSERHPFVIRVGHEDEPWYHIQRTSFVYDATDRVSRKAKVMRQAGERRPFGVGNRGHRIETERADG